MRAAQKPLGNATYVASDSDKEWLQSVQKKLHTRSWNRTTPPDFAQHIYGEPGA